MKQILIFTFMMLIISSAIAQDWPNLSRFKEENESLGLPKKNEKRIIFMGNSITEGWSKADSTFFADHQLIDRGIGGQTTPQMVLRFRQDVIDLKPVGVIILAGINDIAGNTGPSTLKMIEDNIANMAMLAKAANIKVVLSSILPSNKIPWRNNEDPSTKILELNKWIQAFAQKNGFSYVDYYSSLADDKNGLLEKYSYDGVHTTLAGYKVMEKLIVPFIKELRK